MRIVYVLVKRKGLPVEKLAVLFIDGTYIKKLNQAAFHRYIRVGVNARTFYSINLNT